MKKLFCSICTAVFFLTSSICFAAEKVTSLNEIVVSASKETQPHVAAKTNTPVEDIPASISTVSQELIAVQGAVNVDNTIKNISGVTQSSSSNYGFFNNYLIRGLNMNFLRDGVPDATTVNGYSRSLIDVERVEVLKGPGSSLYGSGAPGGTVNLVSKNPEEDAHRTIAQSLGSFQTSQTAFDLTGPTWNPNLLYRFDGGYFTSNGFRDLNKKSTDFSPRFLWKKDTGHEITFDFDYRKIDSVADTYGTPFVGTSLTQANRLLGVSRDNKYYTPFATTEQEIFRGAITDNRQLTDEISLRNNFIVLDRNLYLLRNAGGSVAAGSSVMTGRSLRQQSDDVTDYIYQLEPVLDFKTASVAHKLLTGFEVQYHDLKAIRSTASLPNITNIYNPVIQEGSKSSLTFNPNFNRNIDALYTSLYFQDQVDLTEQWKARVGARTDWFDTRVKSHLNGVKEKRKDNEVSAQAGLVFKPWEMTSFYGGVSTSKQAILSTESSSALNKPEGANQVEVGNKTSFFDGKLDVNLALYRVTRKDFLVTVGSDTFPVGKQRTKGVELDISTEPVKGWKFSTNYSFADAELINVPQTSPNPSVNGNRPTGTPVNSAGFWTTYEFGSGRLKGFGLGGGLTYKGSVFNNLQNTSEIPAYVVGDLVFFYHKDWYETQLNIGNIGDTDYFRNGVNSGALPGDPLNVSLTAKVNF